MPALPPYLIEPIWQQFSALLPQRRTSHPLGCHRPRIPDLVVFEKLVQVLVFGCAYERIADGSCSATTLGDRRDEWIESGVMEKLRGMALDAYDRLVGLELSEVAVDGCTTKAPGGGEKAGKSPVDRGKMGLKRSMAVDASGVPLGAVSAPANRHDPPLLVPTLEAAFETLGGLTEETSVHLDRGYDSGTPPAGGSRIWDYGGRSRGRASRRRRSGPRGGGWWRGRARGKRSSSPQEALVWCTERVGRVIDFWVAFSDVVIKS